MRFTKSCIFFFSLIVLPALGFKNAAAQTNTGTLSGTVRDSTGAVVPDAKVSLRNIGTGLERTAPTDGTGGYRILGLAPAIYDETITKSGFADFKARVEVTVGSFMTVDAQLALPTVTSSIEVVVASGTEINTQSQEVSQIVTPEQIQTLPSLTRNPYDFVALAGNVSGGDRSMSTNNPQLSEGGGQNLTEYRGVGYNINGQRGTGTEVLLDGAENLNIFDDTIALVIPQDSVQEFRIVTNNFDAQYGRAAGGIVNVTTKSGTNSLHGDAWEFNRVSAYTANTFDNNAHSVPKGHYTRNQFGYDVGGAIVKDKLFFYQSTEFLRVRSAANLLAYVPDPTFLSTYTPANVQAWFNAYGNQTFSPISKVTKSSLPFNPGGGFDTKVTDPNAPIFDLVGYTAPQDAGGDLPQNTYELVGRVDYNLTSSTQMYFRYGRENLVALPGSIFSGPYPQYLVGQSIYNNNYLFSLDHTFKQNLLSSTKLSFFRDANGQQYNQALTQVPTLFLYDANSGAVSIGGQPVQLPGFFDFNTAQGGLPYSGPQNTIQINQDVSWTRGRHGLKVGGQYNYIQMNRGYGAYEQAIESLGHGTVGNGLDNFVNGILYSMQKAVNPGGVFPCATGAYEPSTGTPGNPIITPACSLSYPVTDPVFTRSDRYNDWALYAQDSWRVTPRFMFNIGVRYEHYGVQHNNDPSLDSNFYFGSGSSVFEQVRNGSVQLAPKSPIGELWKPRWGTIGPRVGFAYDVFGDGKTALRGGYGITYERNFGNVTFNVIQNVPNSATVTFYNSSLSNSNLGPFAGSSCPAPPQGCGLFGVQARNVDQNIQVAQTQFWGLTVEHKLGSKAVVAVEYNGAHSLHLYDLKNINLRGGGQAYLGDPLVTSDPYNPACSVTTPCLTRPNSQYTNINNRGTSGFSHYQGLNLRFQTRELGQTGLSVVSNYTFSHAMDNLSTTFSESSAQFNLGYLDPRNPSLDYGSADYDVRNRLALELTWTEPYLKGSHGFLKQVGSGWSASPIFTARTGIPFSVWDPSHSLEQSPRYVPSATISSYSVGSAADSGTPNLFNLLTLPPANSFSNPALAGVSDFGPYPSNMTSRNAFRGPGGWSFDLAVSKNFPVTERIMVEFRAEGFDILNHANMYVNAVAAAVSGAGPVVIQGKRGGLGAGNSEGLAHDERRFGQFALRLHF